MEVVMARIAIAILVALSISAQPALAGKPAWAGGPGKNNGASQGQGDDDDQGGPPGKGGHGKAEREDSHFSSHDHDVVHAFYVEQYKGGCPPGLAKKHNGCMPPGLAKKRYAIGQPLPAGFVLAPLPVELSVQLGPPPSGYRYAFIDGDVVRVAELAAGSFMVVDAINGLLH
jgi:hypothetical protein